MLTDKPQASINRFCLKAFNNAMEQYNAMLSNGEKIKCVPLAQCNARVYETNDYYILQSYRTFVACVSKRTGSCYNLLRYTYKYTSTSTQHIWKFYRKYADTYFEIRVYK